MRVGWAWAAALLLAACGGDGGNGAPLREARANWQVVAPRDGGFVNRARPIVRWAQDSRSIVVRRGCVRRSRRDRSRHARRADRRDVLPDGGRPGGRSRLLPARRGVLGSRRPARADARDPLQNATGARVVPDLSARDEPPCAGGGRIPTEQHHQRESSRPQRAARRTRAFQSCRRDRLVPRSGRTVRRAHRHDADRRRDDPVCVPAFEPARRGIRDRLRQERLLAEPGRTVAASRCRGGAGGHAHVPVLDLPGVRRRPVRGRRHRDRRSRRRTRCCGAGTSSTTSSRPISRCRSWTRRGCRASVRSTGATPTRSSGTRRVP